MVERFVDKYIEEHQDDVFQKGDGLSPPRTYTEVSLLSGICVT